MDGYNTFANGAADVLVDPTTGLPMGGVGLLAYPSLTGGTPINDIRTLAGTVLTQITSGSTGADKGRYPFLVPDTFDRVFLDRGYGTRFEVLASELFQDLSTAITNAGEAIGQLTDPVTGLAAKADAATVAANFAQFKVFTPEQYGAVGDGSTDDTAAVRACFVAANALIKTSSTYAEPGAVVRMRRQYNLATLTAPIDVMCNIDEEGSLLRAPSGYTGIAVRVGHTTSGSCFKNAEVTLPSVIGASVTSGAELPAGSIGVQLRNLYSSRVCVGEVTFFETPLHVGGESHGVSYNTISFRILSYGRTMLKIRPINPTGWVNQNTFLAGSISGSATWGDRVTGYRHILIDATGCNSVNGNNFVGTSLEGNVSEHAIDLKNALQNHFTNCRFEQGIVGRAVTLSGTTATATAHGLTVGDMITLVATVSTPTGLAQFAPYYVLTIPTADTFTISQNKAGTAQSFTGGSGVVFWKPMSILYDGTTLARDNVIDNPVAPLYNLDQRFVGPVYNTPGNEIRWPQRVIYDTYQNADTPIIRVRNSHAGTSDPLIAAYPAANDPVTNPAGWTAALSDRGLVLGSGIAELWRIYSTSAALLARAPSDTIAYEIPTAKRSPSATAITGLSCPANTTTATTLTVNGATVGDYVVANVTTAMPAGMAIAHAFVSAANTVTVVFANMTASAVSLTTSVHAVVIRQFY